MIVFIKDDYIRLPNNHSRILSIIQWKNKKAVTKNYDQVLINAGIEKVFDRIIGLI